MATSPVYRRPLTRISTTSGDSNHHTETDCRRSFRVTAVIGSACSDR